MCIWQCTSLQEDRCVRPAKAENTPSHHAQSLRSVLYVLYLLPSPCCVQVALKMVNMTEVKDVQRMTMRLKREIRLMKSLKHENIVEYFERKYTDWCTGMLREAVRIVSTSSNLRVV